MALDRDRNGIDDREDLRRLAARAMRERDLLLDEDRAPEAPAPAPPLDDPQLRDLTHLPWSSIDNPHSRDLDQVECVEEHPGFVRLYVGIAEVTDFVRPGSADDAFAAANTTTVYTAAGVFPMLRRDLSEDRTSLLDGSVRRAMVTALDLSPLGTVTRREHFRALVKNHRRLDYDSVSAWLDGEAPAPLGLRDDPRMQRQLRVQDAIAQQLRARRAEHGSLAFTAPEPEFVFDDEGHVIDVVSKGPTRAGQLIESLMLAVNESVARTLADLGAPCLRRVVPEPPRWRRLRELAEAWDASLPETPDSRALARFLDEARKKYPEEREALDLATVKLVGAGAYRAWIPGDAPAGHFALAVDAYAHSTAPNRRYPDVIVQRLLSAALRGDPAPYDVPTLDAIAARCTERAAAARKVERRIWKSAAALFLSDRVGETFDAVVTGVNGAGTWVRLLRPAVEGRLSRGAEGLDVGENVRARLGAFNVEQGHLDFEAIRVRPPPSLRPPPPTPTRA